VLSAAGPHTNHYLDAGLAELGDAPGAGSLGRYRRLTALLAERPPTTAQDVMRLMADHDASPDAICLHATEDEDSCVVFSMVYDVAARRMWVAPGNPCLHPYEEVDLDAAFL
jgi:isopenicillin-N N-acyltransferase-like protein